METIIHTTSLNEVKLAILIPTIVGREDFLRRLIIELDWQREQEANFKDHVAIIILKDKIGCSTIGDKRNQLTDLAVDLGATHRAFIDDDDYISADYLDLNMPGVYGNYDCNSLIGIYTVNGYKNPNKHIFIHSLKYDHWYEDEHNYFRNPNHLNVCKLDLIKDIMFPESNFGEDGQWSERVHAAGVLKNEYEITKPFYYYMARTKVDGI